MCAHTLLTVLHVGDAADVPGGDVLVEGVGLVEHFAEGRRRGGTGVRGE